MVSPREGEGGLAWLQSFPIFGQPSKDWNNIGSFGGLPKIGRIYGIFSPIPILKRLEKGAQTGLEVMSDDLRDS